MIIGTKRYCKRGHKYQFFPGGRCLLCYLKIQKLKYILKKIEKRKVFMFNVWERNLQDYYDFEYFIAMEGQSEGGELNKLYIEAETLI